MAEAVILGSLELERITALAIDQQRKLARHPIPGWDGDLVQDLGSSAAKIRLTGVDSGEGASLRLADLRQLAAAGEPVDFVASAAVAAEIEQVLVERLAVRQVGGEGETLHYGLELVQHVPPPVVSVAGFDAGFLDELAGLDDAAAAAELGSFVDSLADAGKEAAGAIADAVAVVEDIAETVAGLDGLERLLAAMAGVAEAAV
ncbi:MAG: hypothetical protein AAF560_29910 [Acidobacteriota bacterium]